MVRQLNLAGNAKLVPRFGTFLMVRLFGREPLQLRLDSGEDGLDAGL